MDDINKQGFPLPIGYEFCGLCNDATHTVDKQGDIAKFDLHQSLLVVMDLYPDSRSRLTDVANALIHLDLTTIRRKLCPK